MIVMIIINNSNTPITAVVWNTVQQPSEVGYLKLIIVHPTDDSLTPAY